MRCKECNPHPQTGFRNRSHGVEYLLALFLAHGPLALFERLPGQRFDIEPDGIPGGIQLEAHFFRERIEDVPRQGGVGHLGHDPQGGVDVFVHPKGGQVFVGIAYAGHGWFITPNHGARSIVESMSLHLLVGRRSGRIFVLTKDFRNYDTPPICDSRAFSI